MTPARLALVVVVLAAPVGAEVPTVVADIPPVQSLAAAVMEGVGEPALLLPLGASPHDVSLRPSEARALSRAEVVFTVGEALSPALAGAIAAAPEEATVVALLDVPGTRLHETAEHEAAGHEAGHAAGDGHDHGVVDPHAWLDPVNAQLWLAAMADTLGRRDPGNAEAYAANAGRAAAAVGRAAAEAQALLQPVRGQPVVVLHDAFTYWQEAFGMPRPLAIAASDAAQPGPAHLSALRRRMAAEGITCIMAEPQFDAKLVALVAEGSGARTGMWDPLGSGLEPGPGLYPALLTALARAYAGCASG